MPVALDQAYSSRVPAGLELAPGDVLLVAGKGHEAEQIVGVERRAFSDRAAAAELLGAAP